MIDANSYYTLLLIAICTLFIGIGIQISEFLKTKEVKANERPRN